jgi:hypothetical protein
MSGSLYDFTVKALSIDKSKVGRSSKLVNSPTNIVIEIKNPNAIVPPNEEKRKILKPNRRMIEV